MRRSQHKVTKIKFVTKRPLNTTLGGSLCAAWCAQDRLNYSLARMHIAPNLTILQSQGLHIDVKVFGPFLPIDSFR